MSEEPKFKRGDVIALTNELVRSGSIPRGCCVFEAMKEPKKHGPEWCVGYRSQDEFRFATTDDIDRLIGLAKREIDRVTERETLEIERLLVLRAKLTSESQKGLTHA